MSRKQQAIDTTTDGVQVKEEVMETEEIQARVVKEEPTEEIAVAVPHLLKENVNTPMNREIKEEPADEEPVEPKRVMAHIQLPRNRNPGNSFSEEVRKQPALQEPIKLREPKVEPVKEETAKQPEVQKPRNLCEPKGEPVEEGTAATLTPEMRRAPEELHLEGPGALDLEAQQQEDQEPETAKPMRRRVGRPRNDDPTAPRNAAPTRLSLSRPGKRSREDVLQDRNRKETARLEKKQRNRIARQNAVPKAVKVSFLENVKDDGKLCYLSVAMC